MLDLVEGLIHLAAEVRPLLIAAFSLGTMAVAGGHAVLWKRDPRAALGWLALILALPVAGAVIYAIFGINRLDRKAQDLYDAHDGEGTTGFGAGDQRHGQASLACGEIEVPDRIAQLGLDELARFVSGCVPSPLVPCNRVQPLADGALAYGAMIAAIEGAQRSVTLCTYIFDADPAGERFLVALREATRRGVEVRVLIDAVGDRYSYPPMTRRLRGEGVPCAAFLRTLWPTHVTYANLRNHRKLLVVDGTVAFTGGMNIRQGHALRLGDEGSDDYSPILDLHFRVEGPVVRSLQEVFCEDWAFTTGERLRGAAFLPQLEARGEIVARVIDDGPGEGFTHLRWVLLGALACARRSVRIATPYFLPDEGLITALNTAARRGVEVEIFLPERNNLLLVQWASTAMLWQVLAGGCRVYLVPPPFDHTKLMLVDGAWSLIGSANWDARSLRLNFELDVECYDRELATTLEGLFDQRRGRARETSLQEVDARPLPVRLRDGLARLATPYL